MVQIHLPSLNALLNTLCAVCLLGGLICIKRKRVTGHKIFMGSAFLISILFLISYLYYHFHFGSTKFQGTGWIRPVYFTLLISHTICAAAIVPLVLVTLTQALRGNFQKHAKIARWTWPVWMYVSVTGVIVYLMLYKWFS